MDVMTPAQRRKAMQSNRGRTKPERKLAASVWRSGLRFLTAEGYRSRFGRRCLGNPDLIFTRKRVAVFVDGCFWHCCPDHYQQPVQNAAYWRSKAAMNCERDLAVAKKLRYLGWRVVRIWEHEIEGDLTGTADRIVREVKSTQARA